MSLITSPQLFTKAIEKLLTQSKHIIITMAFMIVFSLSAFSQNQSVSKESIKDFFIPSELKELAKSDYKGAINMTAYYSYKGNKKYEVMYEQKLLNRVTSLNLANLEIGVNEVLLSKVTTENELQGEKTLEFKKPVAILKLPTGNQSISWESRSFSDDIENCTAIFSKTVYNGKEYKTIKVTKKSAESDIQENNYYLKGIGLYKTVYFNPKTKEEVVAYQLTQIQGK